MHNQHINDVRRLARQGASVAVEDVASTLTVAADALPLLQLRDLEHAIAGLPEVQRRAILLVSLEGIPYEDVAAMLGIPLGTLRSRLFRAREKLRELMDIGDATKPSSAVPHPHMRQYASANSIGAAKTATGPIAACLARR